MQEPSSLSQWPDLVPDVLRDISGRLRDAGDFISFHAVCKPWRDSHERTRKQLGLPWLLAPDKMLPIYLNMRCIFSRSSYWAMPPFSIRQRNWVASADGTALWYYTERPSPSLHDPTTGAVTHLPRQNGRWEGSPSGIVYSDGAVLLYHISRQAAATKFRAALLRPGDVAWMVVERTFRSPEFLQLYPVYHRGKILITVGDTVPTPDSEVAIGNVLVVPRPWMPFELDGHFCGRYYVLESRGELLCVSIYISLDSLFLFGGKANVPGMVRSISMTVHALEEDEAAPEKMCWVRKDGGSLADRVLFLGWPNSFAVDASRFSDYVVSGGCAYFVYDDGGVVVPDQPCCVFRYNLLDDKVKFVERLPEEYWYHDMYMWLFPQPSIAPIEELIEDRKWWKNTHVDPTPRTNIYIDTPEPQHYNTYFRVFVRNLPPKVDSIQLRQFFSHHGKVYNGKVMWKRKNKISKKTGLVTIAMVEEWPDALAVLNGLVFNGCILEVSLVRRWKKGLCAPSARHNILGIDYLIYMAVGFMLLFVIGYLIIID